MNWFTKTLEALLSVYLVALFILPHSAFAAETSPVAAAALYEGADRQQRLIAGAKKEGTLTVYSTIPAQDGKVIIADFEKKYGIKVNLWRASANDVLQRTLTEASAGRFEWDLLNASAPEMDALHREKLLQTVYSPFFVDLVPGSVPPHKEWAAIYFNVYVQAYNTTKVKKEELPKSYQDLLDAKWKGRLGIEEKSQEWFAAVVQGMGEEKGLKFFRDLVARNGLSARSGTSLLHNLVVAGEVPLALTVYSYLPMEAKETKAPVEWFLIQEPAIGRANGVGISRRAPHPNAALLFYDFMLTDVQGFLGKMKRVTANRKIESPLKGVQIKLLDPSIVVDEYDKWTKLYEKVLSGK
jgi:iron(III) transport system substrate-binding protein